MKRLLTCLLVLAMGLPSLAGCSHIQSAEHARHDASRTQRQREQAAKEMAEARRDVIVVSPSDTTDAALRLRAVAAAERQAKASERSATALTVLASVSVASVIGGIVAAIILGN